MDGEQGIGLEDGKEDSGQGWFDDADADLDRFMQEDALLEALQPTTPVDSFLPEQDDLAPMPTFEAMQQEPESSSLLRQQNHVAHIESFEVEQAGSASSRPQRKDQSLSRRVETMAEVVNESLGLHSRDSGAKERRLDDARHPDAGSPGSGGGGAKVGPGAKPQKPKPIPWGALALFVVAIFTIVYFALGLFEEEVIGGDTVAAARTQVAAAKYAEPKPISMPADVEDPDTSAAVNGSFGVQRGRISVEKSREVAFDSEGATANATSDDEAVKRGERTRLRRSQGDQEGGLR